MSFIPFQNKSPHTQRTSCVSPSIFIQVYTVSCHTALQTANSNSSLLRNHVPRSLEVLMFLALLEIRDLPPRKSSLMPARSSQNRLYQSKTIAIEHAFPLLLSLKPFHICVGVMPLFAYNFMTALCSKRSVGVRF